MAMIQCSECGKQISDQAQACPYCGCPVCAASNALKDEKKKYLKIGTATTSIGGGVALITYLIMLYLDGRFYDYAHTYDFFQPLYWCTPFELMMWVVLLAGIFVALVGCAYFYRWSQMKGQ